MVGIGYRKEFSKQFLQSSELQPDFIEVAPENWMGIGGYWKQQLNAVRKQYPFFLHGLSLSVGSPDGIDLQFVKKLKRFIDETDATLYSEHLSFTSTNNAHLYDLLPIPFTNQALNRVVSNIKQVQDVLGRRIILENSSYYTVLKQEMSELEFIREIVSRADCDLLLDVNNVFVNAFNHGYNSREFIEQLPLDRVQYIHMAGHYQVNESLIVDTHGTAIIDPVYELFAFAIQKIGRDIPVLLERDFNIPDLKDLQKEIDQLRTLKSKSLQQSSAFYE